MFGKNKKPELSIIIPVLNTSTYLAECLDSVVTAISDVDAEVILVDDGSSDGSVEVMKDYVGKDNRFQLLHSDHSGPGGARNRGVEAARGRYLAFVDSDDFVAPDIYDRMLHVAEEEDSDMVVCGVIRKDEKNKYHHSELHRKAFHNIRDRGIDITENPNLVFDGTVFNRIIRTDLFKANDLRFSEGVYYEDVPVIQKLYLISNRITFLRKWGYCWRIRKGSISQNRYSQKNLNDRIRMLSDLRQIATQYDSTSNYLSMVDYKILSLEFNGLISVLRSIPADLANDLIDAAASFIETNIDPSAAKRLSLYDRQKVKLILERDVDGLIRLLNYKLTNYMNAPVIEGPEGYEMVLPDSIFDIESRSFENEFNDSPFWLSIDSVETDANSMTIHTHVYVRRVNMPDFSSQEIKAFLINDLTGAELELDVDRELRPSLTKSRGSVLNYDDYRYYHYNYDGTGIAFTIDVRDLAEKKEFSGWNYILLECENRIGRKNLVLRFGTKDSLNKINATEIRTADSHVVFSTDEIQVFGVTVNP